MVQAGVQKLLSFWTAPVVVALSPCLSDMLKRRPNGGRGRHKHPHDPDIHHRHGYEHEAARQNSPRKKGPFRAIKIGPLDASRGNLAGFTHQTYVSLKQARNLR